MYDRILIPVGSKTDMRLVMSLAEDFLDPGGDITILYVIPSEKLPVTAVEWRKAMGVISEAQSISIRKKIEVNYKMKNNRSVAQGILKEAASTDYDLLFMANPRTAGRGILFGRKVDEIVRNTTVVLPPKTAEEGYHLSEDLADDAIAWLRNHKAFQAAKPFSMYWASGAIHGPTISSRSGRIGTQASSIMAGTPTGSACSRGPRRRGGSPRMRNSPSAIRPWQGGMTSPRRGSRSSAV